MCNACPTLPAIRTGTALVPYRGPWLPVPYVAPRLPAPVPGIETHEQYIAAVVAAVLLLPSLLPEDRRAIASVRLAYGAGEQGTMGVTMFNRWKSRDGSTRHFVAVCATCQPEGALLLAETVVHELAHARAGWQAGHGPVWVAACARLGLIDAKATYTHNAKPTWSPGLLTALLRLPEPSEGRPVYIPGERAKPRPCPAGIGTKGGKSRGPGSGSRNKLWQCACGTKIRHAGKLLRAKCLDCGGMFRAQE